MLTKAMTLTMPKRMPAAKKMPPQQQSPKALRKIRSAKTPPPLKRLLTKLQTKAQTKIQKKRLKRNQTKKLLLTMMTMMMLMMKISASRRKHARISKHYKIQEVISRRQILLVQVVKEERGNKGAALTTYLSLAGRYCVLMPNTFHGGGVSRKISNPADRKKLKTIVGGLEVPKGNAVIVRTAGAKRTKAEITRDFTYLMRQWDDIRTLTMESSAPSLIHEEGNLIKRSIRDYYGADVDEILVEGEEAHKAAKTHMRNLMPSHVKKVKSYEDTNLPLFQRYQVESMLSAMHEPQVTLKSGGYLVINQTEALVAIDVNSGRATRERNIEETARLTNLEAAEEIATQLRQRDLSGLIVIDFIDMENTRNQHAVERKLKDRSRMTGRAFKSAVLASLVCLKCHASVCVHRLQKR